LTPPLFGLQAQAKRELPRVKAEQLVRAIPVSLAKLLVTAAKLQRMKFPAMRLAAKS
jgi:hypothetical protein